MFISFCTFQCFFESVALTEERRGLLSGALKTQLLKRCLRPKTLSRLVP